MLLYARPDLSTVPQGTAASRAPAARPDKPAALRERAVFLRNRGPLCEPLDRAFRPCVGLDLQRLPGSARELAPHPGPWIGERVGFEVVDLGPTGSGVRYTSKFCSGVPVRSIDP